MFLLLTFACAPEGTTTDEFEREPYQDERNQNDDETSSARTCDEALTDLGYDPWHPTDENRENWYVFGLDDVDWDATERKWLVVRWEAENARGFNVSCDSLSSAPYVESTDRSEYWACSLEAGVDPFSDPDCAQGLSEVAWTGGESYLDEEGDGIYVPEE